MSVSRRSNDFHAFAITLEYSNPNLDIHQAVRDAVNEYIQTKEGSELYSYNCSTFDWADFDSNVPNEICEKYGFQKVSESCSQDVVEWDEELADDPEFEE